MLFQSGDKFVYKDSLIKSRTARAGHAILSPPLVSWNKSSFVDAKKRNAWLKWWGYTCWEVGYNLSCFSALLTKVWRPYILSHEARNHRGCSPRKGPMKAQRAASNHWANKWEEHLPEGSVLHRLVWWIRSETLGPWRSNLHQPSIYRDTSTHIKEDEEPAVVKGVQHKCHNEEGCQRPWLAPFG